MKWADPETISYASELGVNLAEMTLLSSGVYFLDLEEGDGEEAAREHEVTVRYSGWLPNAFEFDTTRGRDPRTFPLDEVILGWSEGVPGMRVGGKRRLVVPPDLGYGQYGSGDGRVPPYSTLIFDVELIAVQMPEEDEG